MDSPIHIDTKRMGLSIVYLGGYRSKFPRDEVLFPEDCS